MSTIKRSLPKYQVLAEHFRDQLTRGELRPGDRLPSLSEMKSQHGASRPTVEKAQSILEQEGWIERLHGAGIFVKTPTAEVRPSGTGIVGLSGLGFAARSQSFYWARLMEGICEAAEATATPLLLLGHENTHGWEKVDGVLISDWNATGVLRQVPPGLPRVSVLASFHDVASVRADDFIGARDAVRYLLDLGHRRIAYLHAAASDTVVQKRIAGYTDALAGAGITPDPKWMRTLQGMYDIGAAFVAEGRNSITRWLADDWQALGCTALLCHNDEVALGVMQVLHENGLRVPGDVSVVGFDGSDVADSVKPRLTTVEVPLREIGFAAFELLKEQMASGHAIIGERVLEPRLKVRESCGVVSP